MSKRAADDFNLPLNLFTGCHAQIRGKLDLMRGLAALAADADAGRQRQAAGIAADLVTFFERTVTPHHREEEQELWPMLERCSPGAEAHGTVHAIVHRLKHEHTELEALWKHLEPALLKLARGKPATPDAAAIARLADLYDGHAAFEDAVVVPMARYLMEPADQYRLAMSMALARHPVRAYI